MGTLLAKHLRHRVLFLQVRVKVNKLIIIRYTAGNEVSCCQVCLAVIYLAACFGFWIRVLHFRLVK